MSESFLVTKHPVLQLRLQAQFPDAAQHIWTLQKFADQITFEKYPKRKRMTSLDKITFINSLGDYGDVALHLSEFISLLKSNSITTANFKKVVETLPFSVERRAHYKKLHSFYERYEVEKNEWLDCEDRFAMASEVLAKPVGLIEPIERMLLVVNELSWIEEQFMRALTQRVSALERVGLSVAHKKNMIQVMEAPSRELEVASVCEQILKLKNKVSLENIAIFCVDMTAYETLLKIKGKALDLPLGFCDTRQDVKRVTVLPLHPNTIVLSDIHSLFILGLSDFPKPMSFVDESEKSVFNKAFGRSVFEEQGVFKERWKSYLQGAINRSEFSQMSTVSDAAPLIKEFFHEHEKIKYVKATRPTVEKNRLKTKSFNRENAYLRQHTGKLLPDVFSSRSLTQFQKCPYGFLVKECFGIHAPRSDDVELTPLQEGEILHAFLWRYFTHVRDRGEPVFDKLFGACIEELQEKFKVRISDAEKYRLRETLLTFIETEKTWQMGGGV